MMLTACNRQAKDSAVADEAVDTPVAGCPAIEGEWLLEHVVVNDSMDARPSEINPGETLLVYFYPDSTFNFNTGCNLIGGRYHQLRDSLSLSDMMWTEMACDNMLTEKLLLEVLPRVNRVDWTNDSIVRLNTPSASYVVLKKSVAASKCTE